MTKIGNWAFREIQVLSTVIFGKGLDTISLQSFLGNNINSITIPPNITTIETNAFNGNPITGLTIGSNVACGEGGGTMGINNNSFQNFYNNQNKAAGTYTYTTAWAYTP